MKNFILILISLSLVIGCTDILDKGPLDEVTEKNYWDSVSDLELYINQFYPNLSGTIQYANLDANSDNLMPTTPSRVLDGSRSIPPSGGGWGWGNIRDINYFFKNASEVTEGGKESIDQYLGEGHFFKAYFYFQKLKRFGDVPWYDEVLNIDSEELYAPRDPRDEIAEHIIENLDKAIDLLKNRSQVGTNRINWEAALAFKSRVCLYEGTWEKYHEGTVFGVEGSNGKKYIQLAAEAAEQLIDKGDLELYTTGNPDEDYWKLFNRSDLTNNSEAILVESIDPELDLGTWALTYFNGDRGKATGITKSLVQSYLASDGKPIRISERYRGDTTLTQTVKNRDPRLEQTMWVPGQVQIDIQPNPKIFDYPPLNKGGNDLATTGYMIRKGSTPDPEQNKGSSSDKYGKIDGMVFRYAEVLLNFAEAKAELETISQSDLDKSINVIRERIGMPSLDLNVGYTDPNWKFPELTPIINEIRRERRVELALEGFRYDDLMRWAAADEVIQGKRWKGARRIKGVSFPELEGKIEGVPVDENNYIDRYQNSIKEGFSFDESRDYLYPIPTEELTKNDNLDQNPGWE